MMKEKNKRIILIIGVVFVILLITSITYTWFKWRSSNNVNVRIVIDNTSGLAVTFNGGQNLSGQLEPTLTKEEGIIKTFSANTNINVPMKLWLKINSLPTELRDSTFKWELYENSMLSNGNFSAASILSNTNNGETDYYLGATYIDNNTHNYTLYLWIDGNVDNNENMASKSFDFDLYATVSSDDFFGVSVVKHINNLYNGAAKSTATVNNITYNLAPSVNLMNDRHASMDTDINGGDIRYYGANPNNYVWLGGTYTSTYTFTSNGKSITRNIGDKKLWRIIGVFDGKLKIVSNDPISTTNMSWDTSANNTSGGNYGYGINQWGESTYSDTGNVYGGSDLMRLLNSGFEEESINNSLYWNNGIGTVYTGRSNATTANVSFANTGLTTAEKNMIDTATWYLGAYTGNSSYVNVQYSSERQSSTLGKNCSSGNYCNDKVVRTATWNGKVGLIYPSDYGYAADLSQCTSTLYSYSDTTCKNYNWLKDTSYSQVTITPGYTSSYACYVRSIATGCAISNNYASTTSRVRPSVYLKTNLVITDGNGSEQYPFVLSIPE